ncbi:MAG: magnesium/cobalt transporter CorA, partial [Desulfoplanes sp.]|nr:magnesium/cobalt transporter CorA [Desulfoplanes sp.]
MTTRVPTRGSKKIGQRPGSLIHVGTERTGKARITVFSYTHQGRLSEHEVPEKEIAAWCTEEPSVLWMNMDGIHDIEMLKTIGNVFTIHPLTLEDILNTEHRPKMEEYDTYLFMVLKLFTLSEDLGELEIEQVSFALGENYILSFQEQQGDVFDEVRSRIRAGKGKIRSQGADYITYALIDAVVDSYFLVLEHISDRIESLEEELLISPNPGMPEEIHSLKRSLILLRKFISPMREVVSGFLHTESGLIRDPTKIYLRDVHDHIIQLIETIQSHRDILSGLLDLYLSSISQRMNEVMKILTIIATIFIPLTFVAGVYGMNFEYMPELKWRWAYPSLWAFMLVMFGG